MPTTEAVATPDQLSLLSDGIAILRYTGVCRLLGSLAIFKCERPYISRALDAPVSNQQAGRRTLPFGTGPIGDLHGHVSGGAGARALAPALLPLALYERCHIDLSRIMLDCRDWGFQGPGLERTGRRRDAIFRAWRRNFLVLSRRQAPRRQRAARRKRHRSLVAR